MSKIWHIADRMSDDVIEHLLKSRSLTSSELQQQFFNPSLADLHSPFSFLGMEQAVARIISAIENNEPIVVWGDFDADGVTSTAILWETLYELGAQVLPYIPSRENEGHGFSDIGMAKLVEDGVKLVVTVDHGITAIEDVAELKKQGIDVVITDHHEPRLAIASQGHGAGDKGHSFELPKAVAVVHPLLMENPIPLAGCGVAYNVAYAVWLVQEQGARDKGQGLQLEQLDTHEKREFFAKTKIELAGIGTIADMVPLLHDNRVMAAYGLKALTETKRPGLQKMYQLAGLVDKKEFDTYTVGFAIGPRLNAPGRLADALESLRLLCTKDEARALRLAEDLNDLNAQRQDLLAVVTEEAKAEVLKHEDGVYVLAKPNWPAGVCGLAAGKIVEQYYRPTVVMEVLGDLSRGSARSVKGFDITAALTNISDLLESYGGHAMAAGFVAKTDRLVEIEQRLSEQLWQQFSKDDLKPQLLIDAEISTDTISWDFYDKLRQFEPCGMANPKPVLMLSGMEVVNYRTVGADGKHLKLGLRPVGSRESGEGSIDAIAFNLGYWMDKLSVGTKIDVAFTLDANEWNGSRSLQLMVKDLRISEAQS